MARMKRVFELKQELIEIDQCYADMPDSYFIDLFLQIEHSRKIHDDTNQQSKNQQDENHRPPNQQT